MGIAQSVRDYEKERGKLSFLNRVKLAAICLVYDHNKSKSKRTWRNFRAFCGNYDIDSMDTGDVIDIAKEFEKCAKKDRYFTVQTSSSIVYAFADTEIEGRRDVWYEILECLDDATMGPKKYVRMAWLIGYLWDMTECGTEPEQKQNEEWMVGYR